MGPGPKDGLVTSVTWDQDFFWGSEIFSGGILDFPKML